MQYENHPAAEIFPPMDEGEFNGLVADIAAHGLCESIVLYDGKVLDGRHRLRACQQLGIEPRFEVWPNSESPQAYVISKNLHRRHLNESQRAMVAARLATMPRGTRTDIGSIDPKLVSNDEAADMLNISAPSVKRAKTILRDGTSEEIEAVEKGEAAVSTTAKNISARTKKPESKPDGKQPSPHGGRISVPDGMTAEDFCREGMAAEPQGLSAEEIAKRLGTNGQTYRMMRNIVALYDMGDLPVADAELVVAALADMNTNNRVAAPYDTIKHIVERVWGKRRKRSDKTIAVRLEEFERAFGHIIFACTNADEIEIPNLGTERVLCAIGEIKEAKKHLNNLQQKLEELL